LLAARGYCARVARTHYENFTVASVLLPRKLLPHFHAVYAYCRWADDLADETGGGDIAVSLLDWWRGEVRRMYAALPNHSAARRTGLDPEGVVLPAQGERAERATPWVANRQPDDPEGVVQAGLNDPFRVAEIGTCEPRASLRSPWAGGTTPSGSDASFRHPVFVALAETVRQFRIPPEPFLDLLTAFEHDQRVKRHATFADVLAYCRNSANPVGRLVLYLFRCADDTRLSLSDEVCTGLQLANFWQDVSRDFAIGRVYLPLEDLARYGVTEADIEAKRFTPAFAELMRFEVDRTRGFFERGRGLLPLLPREVRVDVELFIRGGEATLDAIARQGYDVLTRRPVVTKWEKAKLLGKAVWQLLASRAA
jgi:squalene synthase HpnC